MAVVRYLVDELGLDPSGGASSSRARRGYHGRTSLHWAARNGHVAVARWLVARGARVDAPTTDGTTALCWAAWQGQEAAATFLLDAGADVHALNSYGCNAAMWACQGGAPLALCRALRARGADFGRINANGQGCVHKAAQRGRADVCAWLLGPEVGLRGAEHVAPSRHERSSPARLAELAGHAELARWLEARAPALAEATGE